MPPERELSQLAAPPKNRSLRIEDNPRSASGQNRWRQCRVAPEDGCGIIYLPGVTASGTSCEVWRRLSQIKLKFLPAISKAKEITIKVVALTALGVALVLAQGWASSAVLQTRPRRRLSTLGVVHGIADARRVAGFVDGQ